MARRMTRDQRKAADEALAEQLATFRDSTDPAEQAAYADRFGHYSVGNALLIVMQDPEATVVHGYDQWLKNGRQVRRGETGIRIRRVVGGEDDAETGRKGWRTCIWLSVFDIRQTDEAEAKAAA